MQEKPCVYLRLLFTTMTSQWYQSPIVIIIFTIIVSPKGQRPPSLPSTCVVNGTREREGWGGVNHNMPSDSQNTVPKITSNERARGKEWSEKWNMNTFDVIRRRIEKKASVKDYERTQLLREGAWSYVFEYDSFLISVGGKRNERTKAKMNSRIWKLTNEEKEWEGYTKMKMKKTIWWHSLIKKKKKKNLFF